MSSLPSRSNIILSVLATMTEKAALETKQLGSQAHVGSLCPLPCSLAHHTPSADIQRFLYIHPPIPPGSLCGPWLVCVLALLGTGCKISLWSMISSNQQHLLGWDTHRCFPLVPHPLFYNSKKSVFLWTQLQSKQPCGWDAYIYVCMALLLPGSCFLLA